MPIRSFLAMTAAEFLSVSPLPPNLAWMACHFSPYTTGLSNLPEFLPSGSLLILNDRTPIHGHDPRSVEFQLRDCLESCCCEAILLDLQRAGSPEAAALVEHLVKALPCPVAVSEPYATGLDCPVFLPPLPHHVPLREHLSFWAGREIWLDLSPSGERITLTESGATFSLEPGSFSGSHAEETLHCHYSLRLFPAKAEFLLSRTEEDRNALLEEGEKLGITTTVGLYQEFAPLLGE